MQGQQMMETLLEVTTLVKMFSNITNTLKTYHFLFILILYVYIAEKIVNVIHLIFALFEK